MTDAEKLEKIRQYVVNMSPVFRAAILRTPEEQHRDRGFDQAMAKAQRDLRSILEGTND